nr:uncharacterized protein LOC109784784 [Aegilops tauschii subsp. strangulata]
MRIDILDIHANPHEQELRQADAIVTSSTSGAATNSPAALLLLLPPLSAACASPVTRVPVRPSATDAVAAAAVTARARLHTPVAARGPAVLLAGSAPPCSRQRPPGAARRNPASARCCFGHCRSPPSSSRARRSPHSLARAPASLSCSPRWRRAASCSPSSALCALAAGAPLERSGVPCLAVAGSATANGPPGLIRG